MKPATSKRIGSLPLISATLCLLATACGGGGGGGGSGLAAGGNLTAVSMRVDSSTPNAAHEVTLMTTIRATADFENVQLNYALIEKSEVDARVAEPAIVYIGESVLSKVTAGESEYRTQFIIPKELRNVQDWFITPVVDYLDAIPESNEQDNVLPEGTGAVFPIQSVHTDESDVVMEYVEYESGMLLSPLVALPQTTYFDPASGTNVVATDVFNADFSATVAVTTTGANQVTGLQMYADLYIVEDDGQGGLQPIEIIPLLVWDSDATRPGPSGPLPGNYEFELETTIEPGVPNLVQMELLMEQADRDLVNNFLANQHPTDGFVINFVLDKGNVLAEYENGNLDDVYTGERNGADSDNEIWAEFQIIPDLGGSGQGSGSQCVAVNTSGEWQMLFNIAGLTYSYWGNVTQSNCELSFDSLAGGFTLSGPMNANSWTAIQTGANPAPNRQYVATFTGNPATALSGTFSNSVDPLDTGTFSIERSITGGGGGSIGAYDLDFSPSRVKQEWKDPVGAINIGLDASLNARLTGAGASAQANVRVPFSLFSLNTDLVGFDALGRVEPKMAGPTTGDFNLNFKMLGAVVSTLSGSLPYTINRNEPVIMKTFGNSKSLFGVTVTATANVMFGYVANVNLQPTSLSVEAGPSGSIGATGSGGLNIGIASVAVQGSLNLLEDKLITTATCDLDPPSQGQLAGTLSLEAVNVLKGPSGRLDVVVGVITPISLIKSFWGFITGRRGGGLSTKTYNIFKFDTFEKIDPLFNKTASTTVMLQQ